MVNLNFDEEKINFTPAIYFMNYINIIHDKFLKEMYSDITPRDFTYLSNIFYYQNISQRELSKLLYVSESNVTQIVKRLEKNGYITREVDENNKSRRILYLTDKGKSALFSILKVVYEWEGEFFKDYDKNDVEIFKNMLYEYSKKAIAYSK